MFLGTLGLIKGSLIASEPTVYTEENFKPGQLPVIQKPTGDKIILNENGTSLILKAGTYKAIGETTNWETGEKYIPEYTFPTDVEFKYREQPYLIQLNNTQNVNIEASEVASYQWAGGNTDGWTINVTKGSTFKGDHTWKAPVTKLPASTNLTYTLKFRDTSNVYIHPTNISLSYAYIAGAKEIVINLTLNIMKDNTLVETIGTGSKNVSSMANGTYYFSEAIRQLTTGEYLQILINIPTAIDLSYGSFSTWGTLKISALYYITYSPTPIKIGLEKDLFSSSDLYYLHPDYENIWNLGSIQMSDTSDKMVAYIPPETA